ncbi:MAG: hypothetical protein O9353_10100 [Bacteroidia bacterium]|nr:hypothetical protein [Bacteroidia bacterium]
MMSYEKLVAAIEKLETDGIISLDEFEQLPFIQKRKQYFSVPNPTMMEKAIIIIRNKRNGHEGPSKRTTITEIYEEGKPVKRIIKTERF